MTESKADRRLTMGISRTAGGVSSLQSGKDGLTIEPLRLVSGPVGSHLDGTVIRSVAFLVVAEDFNAVASIPAQHVDQGYNLYGVALRRKCSQLLLQTLLLVLGQHRFDVHGRSGVVA